MLKKTSASFRRYGFENPGKGLIDGVEKGEREVVEGWEGMRGSGTRRGCALVDGARSRDYYDRLPQYFPPQSQTQSRYSDDTLSLGTNHVLGTVGRQARRRRSPRELGA